MLTPGVFAGCGLGAGVVKTCVFPEFCRLPEDLTLPRLPTLPLRSPPAHTHRECGQTLDSSTAMSIFLSGATTSSHLQGVCAEPRCPRWCCSAAPESENPEDSALQSVSLTHTQTHTLVIASCFASFNSFVFFYGRLMCKVKAIHYHCCCQSDDDQGINLRMDLDRWQWFQSIYVQEGLKFRESFCENLKFAQIFSPSPHFWVCHVCDNGITLSNQTS